MNTDGHRSKTMSKPKPSFEKPHPLVRTNVTYWITGRLDGAPFAHRSSRRLFRADASSRLLNGVPPSLNGLWRDERAAAPKRTPDRARPDVAAGLCACWIGPNLKFKTQQAQRPAATANPRRVLLSELISQPFRQAQGQNLSKGSQLQPSG